MTYYSDLGADATRCYSGGKQILCAGQTHSASFPAPGTTSADYGPGKPMFKTIGGKCINIYTGKVADAKNCASASSSSPSLLSQIWGGVTKGYSVVAEAQRNQGELQARQAAMSVQGGGMPSWLLPVGLGLGGLAVVLMLTKKSSSAPTQNPARRRRRRRR